MKEIGIDISTQNSKSVERYVEDEFNYLITVCDQAEETCPFFPGGKKQMHKSFKDPSSLEGSGEEMMAFFRQVRDDIRNWVEKTFR